MIPRCWILVAILLLPAPVAADTPVWIQGFGTFSPFAAFDMPADGHGPSEKGVIECGVGADVFLHLSSYFDLGAGLRYDVGPGDEDTAHFLDALVTARFGFSVGGRAHRILANLSAGLGTGFVGDLIVLGASGEISIGYQFDLNSGLGVFLLAGVRFELLDEQNADPDSYLKGGTLINAQLPFLRLGVAWPVPTSP